MRSCSSEKKKATTESHFVVSTRFMMKRIQTLWPMCCSLPMGFSWSLHVAQSANRTRSNRPPSLRCSVEMVDRGPHLVQGSRGQIALTGHHLYVDNIGIVRDHVAPVHTGLNECRQDSEKSRLMQHQISVSSGSGRSLRFELNVGQLRTLPTVERVGHIGKWLRAFSTADVSLGGNWKA